MIVVHFCCSIFFTQKSKKLVWVPKPTLQNESATHTELFNMIAWHACTSRCNNLAHHGKHTLSLWSPDWHAQIHLNNWHQKWQSLAEGLHKSFWVTSCLLDFCQSITKCLHCCTSWKMKKFLDTKESTFVLQNRPRLCNDSFIWDCPMNLFFQRILGFEVIEMIFRESSAIDGVVKYTLNWVENSFISAALRVVTSEASVFFAINSRCVWTLVHVHDLSEGETTWCYLNISWNENNWSTHRRSENEIFDHDFRILHNWLHLWASFGLDPDLLECGGGVWITKFHYLSTKLPWNSTNSRFFEMTWVYKVFLMFFVLHLTKQNFLVAVQTKTKRIKNI